MERGALALASVLVAACATASVPHPPIGLMWGYIGTTAQPPSREIVVYAPDRPSCEFSRVMAQTRTGLPVPSQIAAQCQELAVLPYREGGEPLYWVFGTERDQSGLERNQFGAGGNDPGLCASLRQTALQRLPLGDTLSECEPVIVRRAP